MNKQVEVDARWIYWRAFLLFFLVSQLAVWQRISRFRVRAPGHRLMVFLLAPWATPLSFALALVAGGAVTLGAILIVRLVIRPLWRVWLNPPVDPSWGLFHLSPTETIISSMPARRRSGWRWQPGSLAVTDRRLWFFPTAWDLEPWSLGLDEGDRIELEHSVFAELAPIRNWPVPFHVSGRAGQRAVFAVANPDAVIAWFGALAGQDQMAAVRADGHQHSGVVDV